MTTYDPALYDLFHAEDADDVRFYVARARETGGPVLELGAGSGRTLLPVARAGIEIHGLDLDARMLDALRAKLSSEPADVQSRVTIHRGDMTTFALGRAYEAIHIPFRAFLHNVDAASQRACLRACFDHLVPGGSFAMNVFHPSLTFMGRNHDALAGVWRWQAERVVPDGRRVVLSDAIKYDTPRQVLSARLRYEVYSPDGALERTQMLCLELAYLHPADIRERFAEAGFVDVRIDGGYDGRPIEHDGDEMVVTARRAT